MKKDPSSAWEALRRFKANLFSALAHPTRIAIVEMLREGELSAGAILDRLFLEQANVSQHLSILRARHIVTNRKEGNQVFYSLKDPLLLKVLDILKDYFERHLTETLDMLKDIKGESKKHR